MKVKIFLGVFGGMILFILIGLAVDFFIGVKWYGFIAPQKKAVEREVFLQSRPYKEAQKQNLIKYMHEWKTSGEEEKKIIEATIRHIYAEYDESELPLELKNFVKRIKYGE